MGIDYLSCYNCGEGFPDVIDYVTCDCGIDWCCDECAELDGYKEEYDDDGNRISTCNYCRNEKFEDDVLLKFALQKLNITKEDLENLYKETL